MNLDNPLISVIIPVYNCERYLAEAIQSVLAQDYRPIEVIVIDDGSTDNSADIAKSFAPSVSCFLQEHCGQAAARNLGIGLAQGSFLAFLDADDFWVPDKLSIQIRVFREDADLDIVFGHVKQFYSPELSETLRKKIAIDKEIMAGYVPDTALIKKESFLRIGSFSEKWRVGEFIDWYLKASESGFKSLMLPEIVAHRRIHEANTTLKQHTSRLNYIEIIKDFLDNKNRKSQG